MTISEDGNTIVMRAPDNWHAHFRQGSLRKFLVEMFLWAGWRGRIIAEPNTEPAILTGEKAMEYVHEIKEIATPFLFGGHFEPLPVMQITEQTTPEMVGAAWKCGVRVCKVYPFFVTTNSINGVKDYRNIYAALEMAAEVGMVVQFHGEDPEDAVEGLDKATAFLKILDAIRNRIPRLVLSLEHISTKENVDWVIAQDQYVGASITIHHLLKTIDDVIGYSRTSHGKLCVDLGCKPTLQRRRDRDALQGAVLNGNRHFFYGGDDAAHPTKNKYCHEAACGVWNTLSAIPLLVQFFEDYECLSRMEPFLSEHGAQFYSFPLNNHTITIIRESWMIPKKCQVPDLDDAIVPFYAGETMQWKVVSE